MISARRRSDSRPRRRSDSRSRRRSESHFRQRSGSQSPARRPLSSPMQHAAKSLKLQLAKVALPDILLPQMHDRTLSDRRALAIPPGNRITRSSLVHRGRAPEDLPSLHSSPLAPRNYHELTPPEAEPRSPGRSPFQAGDSYFMNFGGGTVYAKDAVSAATTSQQVSSIGTVADEGAAFHPVTSPLPRPTDGILAQDIPQRTARRPSRILLSQGRNSSFVKSFRRIAVDDTPMTSRRALTDRPAPVLRITSSTEAASERRLSNQFYGLASHFNRVRPRLHDTSSNRSRSTPDSLRARLALSDPNPERKTRRQISRSSPANISPLTRTRPCPRLQHESTLFSTNEGLETPMKGIISVSSQILPPQSITSALESKKRDGDAGNEGNRRYSLSDPEKQYLPPVTRTPAVHVEAQGSAQALPQKRRTSKMRISFDLRKTSAALFDLRSKSAIARARSMSTLGPSLQPVGRAIEEEQGGPTRKSSVATLRSLVAKTFEGIVKRKATDTEHSKSRQSSAAPVDPLEVIGF